MSNEADREEAYLNKMLNRGKDSNQTKQRVFGGGLEAARVREQGGGPTFVAAPPPPPPQQVSRGTGSYTTTTAYNRPPPGRTNSNSSQSQPRYYAPPLQAEVVELSLPPHPGRWEPPDETSIALNSGISKEELARREEERVGKSIGKFAIAPRGDSVPSPPQQHKGNTTTTRSPAYGGGQQSHTSYGGPSHPPSHGGSSGGYGGPAPPPSHGGGGYGGHSQSSAHTNVSHGGDYTYPEWQIGVITAVDNNSTVLPLSPFGCNAHEISVHVRQNGKVLEIKRSVVQKGAPRNETKNITLPFQVFHATTSATYNANKNGGELSIFFGKPVTTNSSENEVCRFTVYHNPSSNESRVAIGVSQSADHFLFRPERPSMYDTEFTVVLAGSVLEFRSVCIYEDDEGTKTVNAKQTVQLPITPSLDQIESNGDQVTLWVNRTAESSNVGDFQVHISPGH